MESFNSRLGDFVGVVSALASLSLGDVVTADVTEVNEHGALCKLPGDVNGFVTQDLMRGAYFLALKICTCTSTCAISKYT